MEEACVIGYGMVGKATARGFGISRRIDLEDGNSYVEDAARLQYIFICLPTPTVDGECDTSVIREYITRIVNINPSPLFIIRSTVIPGTARKLAEETGARIVSNPEFLTEKTWEDDADHPGLIVIGSDNPKDGDSLRALYEGRWRGVQVFQTDTKTAETIKYALNTFFATKVVFANEIFDFCQKEGVNYEAIKKVLEFHKWGSKNHFQIFHKGGRGAGGRCLPKDLAAFSKRLGSGLLERVAQLNQELLVKYPKTEK